jgi:anti-anti-sigma regulatory factor
LFVKLRPKRDFADDVAQVADHLWSVASRHFIYRLVLEMEDLQQMSAELIEQLVLLQERLQQCGGSLRICGLTADCAVSLSDCQFEASLTNYATRQDAVLGAEASVIRESLKIVLASAASDDGPHAVTMQSARREPCLQ